MMVESLVRFLNRTPNRTFLIYPAIVLAKAFVGSRGRPSFAWPVLPVLGWGYLQYRLCGSYRFARGRGGPGIEVPPEELVTTGPYALVRNPMYLGHIIFLSGLALFARSWLGAGIAVLTTWWFNRRVLEDERRLRQEFGQSYIDYQARVGRWFPAHLSGRRPETETRASSGGM